jgi:hypothetical protein
MKKPTLYILLALLAGFLFVAAFLCQIAYGADVSLAWDYPQPDGFRVYVAEVGTAFNFTTPAATVPFADRTVTLDLDDTKVWNVVVRAYKGSLESDNSNIIVVNKAGQQNAVLNVPIITE